MNKHHSGKLECNAIQLNRTEVSEALDMLVSFEFIWVENTGSENSVIQN